MELSPIQRTVYCGKQDLGSVEIKNPPAFTHFRRNQADILTLSKTNARFFQILCKHTEHLVPFTFQLIHARINAAHQNIGRTAALVNSKKTLQFFPAYPAAAQMDHSRLGQTRQCFMHTVDHYIRTKLRRRYRKIIRKAKMCTMSFIHDQRHSVIMCNIRNPRDI